MADAGKIREWAKAEGIDFNERGPLPKALIEAYDEEHAEPTEADFADAEESVAGPPPADEIAARRERKPRALPQPKRQMPWGKKTGAKKKRTPNKNRVSVADTIATGWRFLATVAKPLPATSMLLKIQAPMAGGLLEPMVKDTIVDTLLQPIAQTKGRGEAVIGLLGPPVIITAMQLRPPIIPLAIPLLRESLMIMCRIGGPSMTKALAEEAETETAYGQTVDQMVALLLSSLIVTDEDGEVIVTEIDEDAAVREMQEQMQEAAVA